MFLIKYNGVSKNHMWYYYIMANDLAYDHGSMVTNNGIQT